MLKQIIYDAKHYFHQIVIEVTKRMTHIFGSSSFNNIIYKLSCNLQFP
ncbi:hypothetical protein [Fictibacillus barbaricus]